MKKIGLFTINDYNNYGNRLQNYATQEVMRSLRFNVETIVNNTNQNHTQYHKPSMKDRTKNLKRLPLKIILNKLKLKLWRSMYKKKLNEYRVKRIKSFKNFTKEYIKETSDFKHEQDTVQELVKKFDYFITGSDQVWNPIFRYGSSVDFLTFAPQHKRIAYAPSFGISSIPQKYVNDYKLWLSEFKHLSVREEAGAKIIKELTDREAVVLVDPTLMLSKEEWVSISKASTNKPNKKYLLTYFLGKPTKKDQKIIKGIAVDNSLEIVNLANIKDRLRYATDPSEFIDYINCATIVCTDSFHGAVFSILMETPFIVFDRIGDGPSMNSRIDTLLSTFKLESRKASNITSNEQIFNVDYSHIPPILEVERQKALNYLKEALEVE